MSAPPFSSIARRLHDAVAGAAWIQWRSLGGQVAAPRVPAAIVDPEALVLMSLWLADDEPRLGDMLFGFASLSSRLLSVQRMKRAMRIFPPGADQRLAVFAQWVTVAAKDPRWRGLATAGSTASKRAGKVGPPATRLGEPASLLLRLRTAFGVDVRTDTLAYLIGRRGAWADVKDISEALFYAKYSVRGAGEALADARLAQRTSDRPVRYYVDQQRWTTLLELPDAPPWQPWASVYAFALRFQFWVGDSIARVTSPTLAASLAREFMLEHGQIVKHLQLHVPDERDHLGEAYLPAFERTVAAVAEWVLVSV